MSLLKARRLISLMLRDAGVPQAALDQIEGLYSFRRVLPTCAHREGYGAEALLDVGGWTDPDKKVRIAMPLLYSEAKLTMQAVRKDHLIKQATRALLESWTSSSSSSSPSWEDLFKFWPSLPSASPVCSLPAPPALPAQVVLPVVDDSDVTVESGVSSALDSQDASDKDSDPEDEIYPAQFAKINWALSQGKAGHLHLGSCGDFSCDRRLRMPEVGQGLSEALATNKQWPSML